MKKHLVVITFAALSLHGFASAHASAVTVNFDDLSTPSGFGTGAMPNNYAGLTWSCPSAISVTDTSCMATVNTTGYLFNPSGYQGAVVSASNVLSSQDFAFAPTAGGTFSFNSAYITGAWRDNQSVSIVGYNGSSVVDSTTLMLGAAGTQSLLTVNWNDLTSVSITASGGTASAIYTASSINSIGVDNLTYTPTSPVPVPAGAWLLLSGLGGMGAMARRRKAA